MNSKKAKQLTIEHGQSQIHVRALTDRLELAEKKLAESQGNLAVVCLAFKKYIANTTPEKLSEQQLVDKLNRLVSDTVAEVNASFRAKGDCRNDKV